MKGGEKCWVNLNQGFDIHVHGWNEDMMLTKGETSAAGAGAVQVQGGCFVPCVTGSLSVAASLSGLAMAPHRLSRTWEQEHPSSITGDFDLTRTTTHLPSTSSSCLPIKTCNTIIKDQQSAARARASSVLPTLEHSQPP